MNTNIRRILLLVALICCAIICIEISRTRLVHSQAQSNNPFIDWRPNADTRGIRYVGNQACIKCHSSKASHLTAPMAQAMETAPDCRIVNARGRLTFRNGNYSYEIARRGKEILYTISDGVKSISKPVLYCFGQGHVGQTFLFRNESTLYETRVSYFEKIKNLDFTIGHRQTVPASLDDALGRAIGGDEQQLCFGCHSTGAVNGFTLKLDQLSPGVGCEACHGPGEKHLLAMSGQKVERPNIFNPEDLSAHDLNQSFCGTCHTGFEQAMLQPGQSGINNIRFQPYRMFNSRGHNTSDRRLSCVTCHDPHEKVQKEVATYDSKCLACHLATPKEVKTATRTASACPISTKDCTTCHMPKIDLPGMHASFTDHWIRIVRPNEPTPR